MPAERITCKHPERKGERGHGHHRLDHLGPDRRAIAKALHKGDEPGGVLGTLFVGILGAVLGGLIASAAGIGSITSFFSIGTWLIAIGGALLLLVIYNAIVTAGGRGRRASSA